MRPRFPLSAKILLWFFANLILIAAAAFVFAEFEFHLGPESLLSGRAGRRVDALADLVNGEVRAETPGQWTETLKQAGNLYGVQLLIVAADGHRMAGADTPLPDAVLTHLFRPHPPHLPQPDRQPLNFDRPPPESDRQRPESNRQRPESNRQPPGVDGQPPPPQPESLAQRPPPPGRGPRPPGERRLLHTDQPSRYWLLLALDPAPAPPVPPSPGDGSPPAPPPHPPPQLTLVAFSDSIGLGGLVIDFTPWIAAAAGVLVFSCLFWLPLVRGITTSIREMTAATGRIAEGRFDVRVRETRADELGLLAGSVNAMAQRLAGFVNGQKRFLGDIAHELCSPLARAQVALGILEARLAPGALTDLQEEVQQMSALVNELLSFSKAALAADRVQLLPVPLQETLARALQRENLPPAALASEIPAGVQVLADPDLLCRALCNILRNSAKYAGTAIPIQAAARLSGAHVILTLADHGPGVPEEALPQLFDPFYRVDLSRTRETGGTGLGLSIVKTCIESCGGRVICQNQAPHGLMTIITLSAPSEG